MVLSEFGISPVRLRAKGNEVQVDDVAVVAAAAAAEVSSKHKLSLFVEDTGLYVKSLGGFPGAYASFVYRTIGLAGILTLLRRCRDRSAEFESAVALVNFPGAPKVFVGRLRGRISAEVQGRGGFGFDPIFVAEGSSQTLAEISMQEKCAFSHRAKALREMGEWLISRRGGESL